MHWTKKRFVDGFCDNDPVGRILPIASKSLKSEGEEKIRGLCH